MASDEPLPPQMIGLSYPATGRSDAAPVVTGGAGDDDEGIRAEPPLGDFVLIAAPWGLELAPIPLSIVKQDKEVSAPLHPEKQCVQCGATETPRWRIQPVGLGALCNACRIWLRPAEALREPVHVHRHLPPAATAISRLAEKSQSPAPAPATAPEEKKQKMTRKRLPCGVRYRKQGRLLQEQEYRLAASPNFKPPEHACKQRGKELYQPPQPAAMQPRSGGELPTAGEPISLHQVLPDAIEGELQMADPSSLDDEFLFNGPSAPMLIDDDARPTRWKNPQPEPKWDDV